MPEARSFLHSEGNCYNEPAVRSRIKKLVDLGKIVPPVIFFPFEKYGGRKASPRKRELASSELPESAQLYWVIFLGTIQINEFELNNHCGFKNYLKCLPKILTPQNQPRGSDSEHLDRFMGLGHV